MEQAGPHKREKHPLAGKTVIIKSGQFAGEKYRIEDWQVNVYNGQSWLDAVGNAAAIEYAFRLGAEEALEEMNIRESGGDISEKILQADDNVLYGKIGYFGKMMHASQIGEVVE